MTGRQGRNVNRLKDAYATLGVAPDAAPLEIRRAYLRLVRTWHPDRYSHDPAMQQRAAEMLKVVNDAYEKVCAESGRRQEESSAGSSASPVERVRKQEQEPAATTPAGERSRSGDAGSRVSFFSSWQNWVFMMLAGAVVYAVEMRYGSLYLGAGYLLEMLALPAVFALACNLPRHAPGRILWRAYIAVVCLFGAVLLYDSLSFFNEPDEVFLQGEPFAPGQTGSPWGYSQGVSPGSPGDRIMTKKPYSGGPSAPVPPQVNVPDAPLAPVAPVAPSAPLAPPAR